MLLPHSLQLLCFLLRPMEAMTCHHHHPMQGVWMASCFVVTVFLLNLALCPLQAVSTCEPLQTRIRGS